MIVNLVYKFIRLSVVRKQNSESRKQ